MKQFIIILIALSGVFFTIYPEKHNALMRVELQTSVKGVSQIYWDDNDKGFSEKKSCIVRLTPLKTKYVFVLPDLNNITKLRFDPIRKPAIVKLKSIIFEQEKIEVIRFQSPQELQKLIYPMQHVHSIRLEQDGLLIRSEGNDPQLALDVQQIGMLNTFKDSIAGYIIGWSAVLLLSVLLTGLIKKLPQQLKLLIASFFKKYIFRLNNIELVTASLVSIAVLYYLFLSIWAMATTSLWSDEIYTIAKFSSQGLWAVLTDYHAPNNHIFFNLLNTLTPGSDSYHPLRARLWSFIAIGGVIAVTLIYFFRRKNYLGGALTLCLLGASWNHLSMMLQARGYAILVFCALATSLDLLNYLKTHKTSHLVMLVLLSVMGTWTVPTYIFFAGPLLLLLFFFERDRQSLTGLLAFGVAILMIYLPIAQQVLEVSTNYASRWGEEYNNIIAVFLTIEGYLFPTLKQWQLFIIFFGFLCLPFLLWEKDQFEGQVYQIIVLSCVLFFTACLYLKTPAIRSTAFIIFPMGIVLIGIVLKIYNYRGLKYFRPGFCIILLIVFYPIIENKIDAFKNKFAPIENWMGSAEFISSVFPETKSIYCTFRAYLLQKYLIGNYHYFDDDIDEFDPQKFIKSDIIFIASHPWKKKQFDNSEFMSSAIEIRIPQTRGNYGYQKIAYVPPKNSNIKMASISKAIGSDKTILGENDNINWSLINRQANNIDKISVTIELAGSDHLYSLNIHTHNMIADDIAAVNIKKNGHVSELEDRQIQHFYSDGRNWKRDSINFDSLITINLAGRQIDEIVLTIDSFQNDRTFSINFMWLEKSASFIKG